MTDPRPPLTDDELSAALDGEAAPDVSARLAQDPAAQQRSAELRAVADALRAHPVDPLDPATVDQLVGRALAEVDAETAVEDEDEDDTGQSGEPGRVVTPLAPARARRSAPPWLVAAAVAVLVAVGLGLVWSGQRDDRDQSSNTAALSAADDAGSGGDSSGGSDQESATSEGVDSTERADDDAPDAVGSGAPAAEEDPPLDGGLRSLGDFPDEAALRSALASTVPTGRSVGSAEVPTSDEVARCDTQVRHIFDLTDSPTATVIATIAGEEVLVFEYERASFEDPATPTTFVTVVDPATCTPRLNFERDPG